MGRILRKTLEGLNPEGLGLDILINIPKVHSIYFKTSDREEEEKIEILLGKAINNK